MPGAATFGRRLWVDGNGDIGRHQTAAAPYARARRGGVVFDRENREFQLASRGSRGLHGVCAVLN